MPLPKLVLRSSNSDASATTAAPDVARSADSLVIARARLSTNSNNTSNNGGGSAPATPAAATSA